MIINIVLRYAVTMVVLLLYVTSCVHDLFRCLMYLLNTACFFRLDVVCGGELFAGSVCYLSRCSSCFVVNIIVLLSV